MKLEAELRERIDELTKKMKDMEIHRDNYLMYYDEMKVMLGCLAEVRHLCWVLDEPVPKNIFDLIR
ncbi:MAG TPA: hypothetical protein VF360_07705 [Candidatus Methanoperedens sp.]|jgi:hypothetical protein